MADRGHTPGPSLRILAPMPLDAIEIETAPRPDAAIVWLHGLGADGHDFEPLVPELAGGGQRAWRFIFPHALPRPVTVNGGLPMRAWYDILGWDRRAEEDAAGLAQTAASVGELIARELRRGVPASRIVLAGFSQGGAVALYCSARYPERLAGVLALSTYLPLAGQLQAERNAANNGTSIFMAHGLADETVGLELGLESREWLKRLGYSVEWHQYPMAHAVCMDEVADIRQYLLRVLPDKGA